MEAVFYGILSALSFTGIMAILCLVILCIFRSKNNEKYILLVPGKASKAEIENLVYGAHIYNLLFGKLICDNTIIFDDGHDEEKTKLIKEAVNVYGGVSIFTEDDLKTALIRKDRHGTGAC